MASNFQQALLRELEFLLEFLVDGLSSAEGQAELLSQIGWSLENVPNFPAKEFGDAIDTFVGAYTNDLLPLIDHPPKELADLPVALAKTAGIINALIKLSESLSGLTNAPAGLEEIGLDLLNLAATHYVATRHHFLLPFFDLLGLVKAETMTGVFASDGTTLQRAPITTTQFDLGSVPSLLGNPVGFLKNTYHLGNGLTDADLTADTLFPKIAAVAQTLGLPAFFGFDPTAGTDLGVFGNARAPHMLMVFVPVNGNLAGTASAGFGVGLALNETLGLVVSPFGGFQVTDTLGRWGVSVDVKGTIAAFSVTATGVTFDPNGGGSSASFSVATTLLPAVQSADPTNLPVFQVGSTSGTRLEISQFSFTFNGDFTSGSRDFGVLAQIGKGSLVLVGGDGDGFLSSVLPASSTIQFNLGVGWSTQRGLYFVGAAALDVTLPVSVSVGGVLNVQAIHLTIAIDGSEIDVTVSATAAVKVGPVTATVDRVGLASALTFPDAGGNLGPLNGTLGFHLPTGVGIAIDAGSVHGGGFISVDEQNHRYVGALQLSVYDIAVNAFALIETVLPSGPGYSFVIVISAQFTPIQLGFGFTLNGVGGLVGINRSIDTNALASLVRSGQSEELLFPKNVIADAPTIVKDLTTVFPATQGRYVFGPLGKLGWGTPTLITGEIGIILEYPALVVVLLGEVKCLLPKPDQALIKLNLSIDGVLDFPNKMFSMDADLHDSVINGFPVSGQMAMRVSWGDQPNFIFSIGGFHPAYTPPPNFPKLQPMTLDLGSHSGAKISVTGFFAVTSNTVQVGGTATLHAGGSGITLDASVSVKALLIFQPFSFEADIDASVSVSFHGYGIGVHLSGTLDGPSPWHVKGEVCVSVLWWDACLGFDVTFGGNQQITQPAIDPWVGVASSDPTTAILGLHDALSDAGNWSGALVPGTVSSVTRAQGTDTLIDPVGGLTVRQKTAPVETPNPLTKFGVAKTPTPIKFSNVVATLGTVSLTAVEPVKEFFAPAQFFDMDDGKKLSSAGFEPYQAGYLFATADNPQNVQEGSAVTFKPKLVSVQINSDGSDTPLADYTPTDAKVTAANQRSAVAKGGLTQAGTRRFVNRAFAQAFTEAVPTFVISDSATLKPLPNVTVPAAAQRSATLIALDSVRAQNIELAVGAQVTAVHEAVS